MPGKLWNLLQTTAWVRPLRRSSTSSPDASSPLAPKSPPATTANAAADHLEVTDNPSRPAASSLESLTLEELSRRTEDLAHLLSRIVQETATPPASSTRAAAPLPRVIGHRPAAALDAEGVRLDERISELDRSVRTDLKEAQELLRELHPSLALDAAAVLARTARLRAVVATLKIARDELRPLEQHRSAVHNAWVKRRLVEEGAESFEAVDRGIAHLYDELRALQRNPLKAPFLRKEIEQKQVQIDHLRELRDLSWRGPQLPDEACSDYRLQSLEEDSARAPWKVWERTAGDLSAALRTRAAESSVTPLSDETRRAFRMNLFDALASEHEPATDVSRARAAWEAGDWQQCHSELNALRSNVLYRALASCNEELDRLAPLVQRGASLHDTRRLHDSLMRGLEQAEAHQPSRYGLWEIKRHLEETGRAMGFAHGNSGLTLSEPELLARIHPEVWRHFVAHPRIRSELGEEKVALAASRTPLLLLEAVLSHTGDQDSRTSLCRRLVAAEDPRTLPMAMLVAFTEPGHSGTFPLRQGDERHGGLREIAAGYAGHRAALKQPPAVIAAMEALIAAVNTRPKDFQWTNVEGPTGEVQPNPAHHAARQAAVQLAELYLSTGSRPERHQAVRSLDTLSANDENGTSLQTLHRYWREQSDPVIREQILELALRRCSWLSYPGKLLDALPTRSPSDAFQRAVGSGLFCKLAGEEMEAGHILKLSGLLEMPAADLRTGATFIGALLKEHSAYSRELHKSAAGAPEVLGRVLQASRVPEGLETIRRLHPYGYRFPLDGSHDLTRLVEQAPEAMRELDEIRRFIPTFEFTHSYGYRSPYDLLMHARERTSLAALISASDRAEVAATLRTTLSSEASRLGVRLEGAALQTAVETFTSLRSEMVGPRGEPTPFAGLLVSNKARELLLRSPAGAAELRGLAALAAARTADRPERTRDLALCMLDWLAPFQRTMERRPEARRILEHLACELAMAQLGPETYDGEGQILHRGSGSHHALMEQAKAISALFNRSPATEKRFLELLEKRPVLALPCAGLVQLGDQALEDVERTLETLAASLARCPRDGVGVLTRGLDSAASRGWLKGWTELSSVLTELEDCAKRGMADATHLELMRSLLGLRGDDEWTRSPAALSVVREYVSTFGPHDLPTLFQTFIGICFAPELTDELKRMGIKKLGGPPGLSGRASALNELRQRARAFQRSLRSEGEVQLRTPLEAELFAATTRIGTSQWSDGRSVESFLEAHNRGIRTKAIRPLSPSYRPATFLVNRLDAEALSAFRFSEPCTARLSALQSDLASVGNRNAERVLTETRPLVLAALAERAEAAGKPLSEKDAAEPNAARRQAGRERERQELLALQGAVRQAASPEDALRALVESERGGEPFLAPFVRRLALACALGQGRSIRGLEEMATAEVNRELLAGVAELFQNAVMEETSRQLGLTAPGLRRLEKACSVVALSTELGQMAKLATAGKDSILMYPTRGALAAASGYMADACWRGVDLSRYPELVTGSFFRNPDQATERPAGATLLMPAETQANETKVLVIRGFNPLQNVISQLDAADFFERCLDELEPMARAEGAELFLIPGGACGGSQTNRPDVNLYLNATYCEGKTPLSLKPSELLRFNHYDIADSCFIARDLRPGAPARSAAAARERVASAQLPEETLTR